MRTFLILFVGFILSFGAKAQAPEFDDLKILFADGSYEKLVRQCEKYMNKDDTKKNPHVYLWMAKALYKIDISGNATDNFKNAFKDGINYLGKCFKYDEDGTCQSEHEDFINDFTRACVERIVNDAEAEDYKKAYGWVVKYKKIARYPAGLSYMEGACKFRNSDKGGANTAWKQANEELETIKSLEDWPVADRELLKHGVLQTADALVTSRQISKAQELLNKVAPWFEADETFKAKYNKIVN